MVYLDSTWLSPGTNLTLGQAEVHLWAAHLDQPEPVFQALMATLSPDEKDRAARFHFAENQRHYVVGRGVLRHVLAHYLNAAPEALYFVYNPQGKPALGGAWQADDLHFNVSHSRALAVYALIRGCEIGVDVEYLRPVDDLESLAAHCFSAAENTALAAVPSTARLEAFFNGWTRKEAFIKAVGEGLSHSLNSFDVSLAPGETARLQRISNDPTAAERWFLQAFVPAPNYTGALAVEGPVRRVQYWHWRSERFVSEGEHV